MIFAEDESLTLFKTPCEKPKSPPFKDQTLIYTILRTMELRVWKQNNAYFNKSSQF